MTVHFVITSSNNLTALQICAIESACRIFYGLIINIITIDYFRTDYLQIHLKNSNICASKKVELVFLKVSEILSHSPLKSWFESGIWKNGYSINNLSNAVRLACVYRFGGIYLDLDYILLPNVVHFKNFKFILGYEDTNFIK